MKKYVRQKKDFGGSLDLGKRKLQLPLEFHEYGHCVLKAQGSNLLWHKDGIEQTILRLSRRFGIELLGLAVHADHIHQIPKFPNRENYIKWSRSLPGVLTRKFGIRWKYRPFTKFVEDPDYISNLIEYVNFNKREGEFILAAHLRMKNWCAANLLC